MTQMAPEAIDIQNRPFPDELTREAIKRIYSLSEVIVWRAGTIVTFRTSCLLDVCYIYHVDQEYCAFSLSSQISSRGETADTAYVNLVTSLAVQWRQKVIRADSPLQFWRVPNTIAELLTFVSSRFEPPHHESLLQDAYILIQKMRTDDAINVSQHLEGDSFQRQELDDTKLGRYYQFESSVQLERD